MEFTTPVVFEKPRFLIEPEDELLFVGSCFADNIGQRFRREHLQVMVNPFGTMYNPASVLHTIKRLASGEAPSLSAHHPSPRIAFLTLGTNHVYRLRETGEIVDNCQKRPASLFQEEQLTIDECADYLCQCVDTLRGIRSDMHVVFTVSPIRYRKYGYHESQLSKATLLLAVEKTIRSGEWGAGSGELAAAPLYFPAYEIVLDELRDYRFYKEDMLHPSDQAVDYIWEKLHEYYFSPRLKEFLRQWAPIRAALGHKPFNPDSQEHKEFMAKTQEKLKALRRQYPSVEI